MNAITYHDYGSADVLKFEDIEQPKAQDHGVLIRVRAASVNPIDWYLMKGSPYILRMFLGLRRPKLTRPGRDVAGQVEAVGRKVTRFKTGDAVFGAYQETLAECVCAPETALVLKPENVTYEQAAAVPVAGLTALQGLRDQGRIHPGQKVLINGAAGGVGTFAVQIAKSFGGDVTGVCSTRNVDLVRSIGADRVIDYTRGDFTRSEQRYDQILDCVGNHPLSACRRVLTPRGIYVMVGAPKEFGLILTRALHALILSRFVSQKFRMFVARLRREDLTLLGRLMEEGKVRPVIDRRYRLSEVPDAMRYLAGGHARGKVVISFGT